MSVLPLASAPEVLMRDESVWVICVVGVADLFGRGRFTGRANLLGEQIAIFYALCFMLLLLCWGHVLLGARQRRISNRRRESTRSRALIGAQHTSKQDDHTNDNTAARLLTW